MTEDQGMSENVPDLEAQLQTLQAYLERIEERLENSKDTSRLWTLADVAGYMAVSEMTARRIMSHSVAPKPVRLPTRKDSSTTPRWVAQEVIEFALRRSHRTPHAVSY